MRATGGLYCTRKWPATESGTLTLNAANLTNTVILTAAAYLIGSIPSAVIAARLAGRPDPRTVGTRNAGSSNVARTVGLTAGVAVFAADLLKGVAAAAASGALIAGSAADVPPLGAVLGQIVPLFSGFRGGKGVATTLGGYVGLAPALALAGLLSWAAGLALLRRFVPATVSVIVGLAVAALVIQDHVLFALGAAALTLLAHRHDLATWRRGELPTIREALRDNRPGG